MASAQGHTDRLSSTLFVAVLAHGIVILGVTFAPGPAEEPIATPTLNVTLLVDTELAESQAAEAAMLSSRNQAGGGNDDALRATRTLTAEAPMNQKGEPLGVDTRSAEALAAAMPVDQVVSRNPSNRQIEAIPETTDQPAPVPMTAAALLQQSAPETLAAEVDLEVANASRDKSDLASPSTRESAIAAYVVGWRQRVERIGTANFPLDYLRGGTSSSPPLVQVTIDAEGLLQDATLLRSSGNSNLDQAALTILELSGPFDPLPAEILAESNVVQFRYEWHFNTGEQAASRVR